MSTTERKPSKRVKHLRVPVTSEEQRVIVGKATSARLSTAAYLRRLGCGFNVESVVDIDAVSSLAKISADQGRLGGLLKLWLTSDDHLERVPARDVRAILGEVEECQGKMMEVLEKMLK